MSDIYKDIRREFPILNQGIFGNKLIYLDNAATTQKPKYVIDRLTQYYSKENSNIHRGPYGLSMRTTDLWKESHEKVAKFLNARRYEEIVFTRNTTEGLNLLVNTIGADTLKKDDIVVITEMEHHSNIVPWLILQKRIPFKIEYIPVKADYTLDLDYLKKLIKEKGSKIKIVSIVHISNVLGVKNDVKEIFNIAKKVKAFTILDAAQSVAHVPVDVQDIDCDALVMSGHKIYGPTGSGALYCKYDILKNMSPYMGGGEMISNVTKDSFGLNDLPWRFEAGTPDIGDGIVLGDTLEWFSKAIESIGGWDMYIEHEQELIRYFLSQFDSLDWFKHFGPNDPNLKYGAIAFNILGFSFKGCKDILNINSNKKGSSISEFLDQNNICFREGFHCAEPLHEKFCVGPTLRISLGIYNTKEDLKFTADKIKEVVLRSA